MKALQYLTATLAALSLALSIYTQTQMRDLRPRVAPHTAKAWSQADEAAVATLLTKTPQQLGGYMSSLRKGTQRHTWTEAQLTETLYRMETNSFAKRGGN